MTLRDRGCTDIQNPQTQEDFSLRTVSLHLFLCLSVSLTLSHISPSYPRTFSSSSSCSVSDTFFPSLSPFLSVCVCVVVVVVIVVVVVEVVVVTAAAVEAVAVVVVVVGGLSPNPHLHQGV